MGGPAVDGGRSGALLGAGRPAKKWPPIIGEENATGSRAEPWLRKWPPIIGDKVKGAAAAVSWLRGASPKESWEAVAVPGSSKRDWSSPAGTIADSSWEGSMHEVGAYELVEQGSEESWICITDSTIEVMA